MTPERAWSVEVKMAGRAPVDPELINSRIDVLLEHLAAFSPSVSGSPEEPTDGVGEYGAQLAVEADAVMDALIAGANAVRAAAEQSGLPDWPVVKLAATEWSEFERELNRPNYPALLGVAELAELLKVSRQRASELARTVHFPRPSADLAAGPVWFETNVRRFLDEWVRRPGRRQKTERSDDEQRTGT